jgi:hypothetical protein
MFKELYTNFPTVLKYHVLESTDVKYVSMNVGHGHTKELTNLKFAKEKDAQLCTKQFKTLFPSILIPPGLKEVENGQEIYQDPSLSGSHSTWTRLLLIGQLR